MVKHHNYRESRAAIENVYEPVDYMMKRLRRKVGSDINNAVQQQSREYEGAKLHRDGVFLTYVEGDEFYDYILHYDEKRRLKYFVQLHKQTARADAWELFWSTNGSFLERYKHELLYEGDNNTPDAPNAPYEGYGVEIDGYL